MFIRSLFLSASFAFIGIASADVTITEQPDRIRVEIDGKLFTEMHHKDATHVYYWPVIGPGGAKMTRAWPMESPEGEEHDHPHHRSLWFAHGLVNGADFWSETATTKGPPKIPLGKIILEKVVAKDGGAKMGVLQSQLKWEAPDGSIPLRSIETLRVYSTKDSQRMFDFEEALTAGEKDVVMGDSKEGTFAMRIADTMRLKRPKGMPDGEGHIINSEGLADDKAWGQRAKWVDMSGPVDGKVLGIAIFDNPGNMRFPSRWHARDYGLFAANPFCGHEMDKSEPVGSGNYTIKAGETLTLKYRVIIHEGDAAAAKIAERFDEYAKAGH